MVVKLERGAIWTSFKFVNMSATDMVNANALIRQVTQARPQGYRFMPKFQQGRWDGYINLTKGNKFPTGLTNRVIETLDDADYTVHSKRNCDWVQYHWLELTPDMFDTIMFKDFVLRDYQVAAVRKLLAYERGIAKMATNSGKTAVIAAIAKIVQEPILVLVTKLDIMYQTADMLSDLLETEPIGIIGDGHCAIERVTVGMVQTLNKRLDAKRWWRTKLGKIGCVIFDECHHLPSKTAQDVMFAIPAPLRFGFSGTPLSYDTLTDLILIGATGDVLVEVTNQDLIQSGISATPTVYMYEGSKRAIDFHTGDDLWTMKWQDAYQELIVGNIHRNDVIVGRVVSFAAKSALILVERIEHGVTLNERIWDSIFVHGSNTLELRQWALDQLRAGEGAVVIATPIFDEGVDLPAVDLLVLAGGGKGHKKLLQRVGRGMRQKEGDNRVTIIDFMDGANKHLSRHSQARMAIYKQEGFEVVVE